MISETEFSKVFKIFRKNYVLVPLEIFGDDPYKTLVSTVMSARTNDSVTLLASERLFKLAPNFKKLEGLEINTIEKTIFPVGFYKTKAKHLHTLASKINKDFAGRVPKTREELMTLHGVGRKTANLVLNRAFKIPAVAVDTHVHRITNLLGWVKTKTPEETEKELTRVLPEKYWPDTNRLFVSIGRQFTSKKKLNEFLKAENLI